MRPVTTFYQVSFEKQLTNNGLSILRQGHQEMRSQRVPFNSQGHETPYEYFTCHFLEFQNTLLK